MSTTSSTKPPATGRPTFGWLLQVVVFAVLGFAAQGLARVVGNFGRALQIPSWLLGPLVLIVGLVIFLTVAKYFIAWRMPPTVETETMDFSAALENARAQRTNAPPIPNIGPPINVAQPADLPAAMDIARFSDFDAQLKALGFVPLLDYRRVDPRSVIDTVYTRVLVHPEQHCLGRITQIFPIGAPTSQAFCTIESAFEDGYLLTISNRKPDTMSYLLRVPRNFWMRHAQADATTLLATLLQERETLRARLDLTPISHFTPELLLQLSEQSYREFRRALMRKNVVVGLVEMVRCKMKLPTQWLG